MGVINRLAVGLPSRSRFGPDADVAVPKAIQRQTGATFHLATRLFSPRVRRATYVLYAYFRVADDVVDDPDPGPPERQRERLEALRGAATGERDPEDEVTRAMRSVVASYDVDHAEIHHFVDAMARDVAAADYETHDELAGYLRGSSVAVAQMLLAVMDPDELAAARPHARALAEAFQLTNFVRDVREDVVEYDRVYLPRASLAEHGVTPADLRALRFDDDVRAALAAELRRTEGLYRYGVAGIEHLPRDCQFAVLLAAVLYADHHRLIRERDYDVVSETPSLSKPRRLWLLARTWLAWQRSGDPVTVFERVAPIDPAGTVEPRPPATGPDPDDSDAMAADTTAADATGDTATHDHSTATTEGDESSRRLALGSALPWVGDR